ncbi:MAG: GTP 3',8-cyclase MoaA, partial [Staphylococcus epidermidis]|nr:GTP 3',8-cyclase MoaA [Staphylococcus epidermidis]
TDDDLKAQFKRLWSIRNYQYSDNRTMQTIENKKKKKINMNYIGG